MATITENYVSFETAKLLKEKGFDERTIYGYIKSGDIITDCCYCNIPGFPNDYDYNNTKVTGYYVCAKPTLQMAMKWLRKEHNLCIVPLPVVTDDDGEGGCLWKYTISMKLKVLFDSENLYESPEIASDDATKCCLENLI